MRFNKLDLNLLVVLDAVLTTRSVSRAAERLYLSQPATSLSPVSYTHLTLPTSDLV